MLNFLNFWFLPFLVFCAHALAQIVLASFAKARCGEPQHFTACHFEPFVKRRKIHRFKAHFEFKAKNSHFNVNLHFVFVDTSLSCESSV